MPMPEQAKICSQLGAQPYHDRGDLPGVHVKPSPDELEHPHK